jgi:hypothetical protein
MRWPGPGAHAAAALTVASERQLSCCIERRYCRWCEYRRSTGYVLPSADVLWFCQCPGHSRRYTPPAGLGDGILTAAEIALVIRARAAVRG